MVIVKEFGDNATLKFDLDLYSGLDLGATEKILPQGIHMRNMKALSRII